MKFFKYLFTAVLALIASVALNSAAGATLACVAGFSPAAGACWQVPSCRRAVPVPPCLPKSGRVK